MPSESHKLFAALAVFVTLAVVGCEPPKSNPDTTRTSEEQPSSVGEWTSSKLETRSHNDSGKTLFEELSADVTGIDAICRLDISHPMKRLYHSGFVCGGVAIGDLDGDDRPDIFFANGPHKNRLFFQTGSMNFEEYAPADNVNAIDGGDSWAAGVTLADIDNDGDLDIYVCNYDRPNQLFINDGNRKFHEAAAAAKLDLVDACLNSAFFDFDRDGDLDVYVLTNRYYRANGRPRKPPVGFVNGIPYVLPEFSKYYALTKKPDGNYDLDNAGRRDYFLKNNGDGTFEDATESIGHIGKGHGLSVTCWDHNHDGWPDIYIGNDFNDPDYLLHNNGNGTFTNVLKQTIPHTSWFSMGADFGDLNNDGLFDFLVADMSATTHYGQKTTMGAMNAEKMAMVAGPPPQIMKNALYVNSGTDRFLEAAELAGLADSDWTWAIKLADFDNDGRNDVFISNGMARSFTHSDNTTKPEQLIGHTEWELHEDEPTRPEKNRAFRNLGNLKFEDVATDWGLEKLSMSYGSAYADLDRDGDLDLVVANLEEPVSIYRNNSAANGRLIVTLKGSQSNSHGIGATLELKTNQESQVRMLSPQTGFLSGNEPKVHFGLGDALPEKLTVRWPSGAIQVIEKLLPDTAITITEPDSPQTAPAAVALKSPTGTNPTKSASTQPWFQSVSLSKPASHKEIEYDDFKSQPLLPNKLSQLGPGIAVADIDGDGDEDYFQGGARGTSGKLVINDGKGGFAAQSSSALTDDAFCEDMGAVWFDVDADGDQDLYVVSGGVETTDKAQYQDRLYLNDGTGKLTKSTNSIPALSDSGGSVAAADFDQDGDLDLFVGGRVVPGKYPISPASRLLENKDGKLTDATREKAEELLQSGLVTGCVWSDANNDGWIDLILSVEWGPIRFFENQQGKLVEKTSSAGLDSHTGWWNGIAARDFDNDGDIDLVATNFGLNTKYHASTKKPVMLYYGDFSGDGSYRLVEAEFEDNKVFPVRGKSCSTHAMPHLADKFKTYHEFALASLEDIYTPECLEESTRMMANTLESGVFLNSGDGTFRFQALPRLAQVSPAFGVVASDVNHDGNCDLYLVQNFFTAQPETGRMDGGLSQLLVGKGDGTFEVVMPSVSGLSVQGDAMGLATVEVTANHFGFAISQNDDDSIIFQPALEKANSNDGRALVVRLVGPEGNPTSIGAKVEVVSDKLGTQTAEVTAGSGYLSQSSPGLVFGWNSTDKQGTINVRWPNGSKSTHKIDSSTACQKIEMPQ